MTINVVASFCCCEAVDVSGKMILKWMGEWTEFNWIKIETGCGLL